jgi:ribosomal-protein-alanine N-acetyltransferase
MMAATGDSLLRRATVLDGDAMALIHAEAFPPEDAWSSGVFSQQLGLPGVFGLLTDSGGMILMRVVADEAEVLTLAVAPEARGRGIASALLHESKSIAAGMGAAAIFLEVSVNNSNARAVYARAGFRRVGERRKYYSDQSDALVLRFDVTRPGSSPTGC